MNGRDKFDQVKKYVNLSFSFSLSFSSATAFYRAKSVEHSSSKGKNPVMLNSVLQSKRRFKFHSLKNKKP
jgi:hypothetical protein